MEKLPPPIPCHYYTNRQGDVFITNSLYIAVLRAKAHGTSVFTYEK